MKRSRMAMDIGTITASGNTEYIERMANNRTQTLTKAAAIVLASWVLVYLQINF
jgi:hypothetical protein